MRGQRKRSAPHCWLAQAGPRLIGLAADYHLLFLMQAPAGFVTLDCQLQRLAGGDEEKQAREK
jgi:hypothetical protein